MSLFNEYENKNLQFIINYINRFNMGNIDPISKESLRSELTRDELKLTSSEIVEALLNNNTEENQNLYALYSDEDGILAPLLRSYESLPLLLSSAERAWLYMVLNDPKADLFINPGVKRVIASTLSDSRLIDIDKYTYRTEASTKESYSNDYINNFRTLISHISKNAYVEITSKNISFDILPFRIIYHEEDDSFAILAYDSKDIIVIDIDDISFVENSSLGIYENKNKAWDDLFSELLLRHQAPEPISLKILNKAGFTAESNMADDRFNHLFSQYKTHSYECETGELMVEIEYYDFQYNEVLEKLLSLGKYVYVIGPGSIQDEIISIHKKRLSNLK